MPRTIWNEGRVVGYSAYEMYIRHALSVDPEHKPVSEKEWLASMMAMGSSMLLRIGADDIDAAHFIEVDFPEDSRLCAANTIMASFFSGEGYVGDIPDNKYTGWATKVIDYGQLIYNESSSKSPSANGNTIEPTDTDTGNLTEMTRSQMREYMKITDGIIIQPGSWTINPNNPPYKDFKPILSECPKLRIAFSGKIETPFFILLTGFTNRAIIDGVTGFDSAVNTQSPQDGDFLGPWAFPWAAKVIFSVPPSFINYFTNNYSRKMPNAALDKIVNSTSIIDMETTNPHTYYSNAKDTNSKINIEVSKLNIINNDANILAVYRYPYGTLTDSDSLPGALYGGKISNTGTSSVYPIDAVAPGTLKLFHYNLSDSSVTDTNEYKLAERTEKYTNCNYSFLRDNDSYIVSELKPVDTMKQSFDILPVSDDRVEQFNGLQVVNTPYIYPTILNSEDELEKISNLTVNINIRGYVTAKFMEEFTIPWDSDSELSCSQFINQIQDNGGGIQYKTVNQIDDSDRPNYKYAVINGSNSYIGGLSDTNAWILPIKKLKDDTGYINIYILTSYSITISINLYNPDYYGYVGTWWGIGNNNESGTRYCLEDHPTQVASIDPGALYYQQGSLTPKPPTSYMHNFLKWFKQTSFSDLINSTTCSDYNDIKNIFKQGSVFDFFKNAIIYDLKTGELKNHGDTVKYHFFDIESIKRLYGSPNLNINVNQGSTIIAKFNYEQSFFYPATISTSSNKINEYYMDDAYIDTSHAIVTSVGQSGLNTTKSISLLDLDGIPLMLTGNENDVSCDKLTWQILLEALNANQSIDILESNMRQLKAKLNDAVNTILGECVDGDYAIHIDKSGSISLNRINIPTEGAVTNYPNQ